MKPFNPYSYKKTLLSFIKVLQKQKILDKKTYAKISKKHTKPNGHLFTKSQVVQAYRQFVEDGVLSPIQEFTQKLKTRPVRTLSGVAPVTLLTKPFPCPGKCIFCPTDIRMPKSYLPDEPGAQRAEHNKFDPYLQTYNRIQALYNLGHPVDKAEIIILGGTWSYYPKNYQLWFITRIFQALNDWKPSTHTQQKKKAPDNLNEKEMTWEDLYKAQKQNENAKARCVGLVIETRPDFVTEEEVTRLRHYGCTKIQIGIQSLNDDVLKKNKRGHTVQQTRKALQLLRLAGFKIHAHWMANLYGSDPQKDIEDYTELFKDKDFRPDELKIYPCSLIDSAELMDYYKQGKWKPHTHKELLDVLVACICTTPEYCRLTRVVRDIPSPDIVVGNKTTNFRQLVEKEIKKQELNIQEIRSREIRNQSFSSKSVQLDEVKYTTSVGDEVFLQFITSDNQILGFLRLSLPKVDTFIDEISNGAMIREIHVYGRVAGLQSDSSEVQHMGFGRRLVVRAKEIAREYGYTKIHVISAIGTREYYRKLGFTDGELYQTLVL